MNYNIKATPPFEKQLKKLLKKYPSLNNEFKVLIASLYENPKQGDYIGLNCYKIRLAIASKGKGKSGGARVVTYFHISGDKLSLITIYDKSERANITSNELKDLVNEVKP